MNTEAGEERQFPFLENSSSNESFYQAALRLVERLQETGSLEEAANLEWAIATAQAELQQRLQRGQKDTHFPDILLEIYDKRPFFMMRALKFTLEEKIEAERDPLTDFKTSRKEFFRKISVSIKKYIETGEDFSLIYVDMNNLKVINDTFGHQQGDSAIKALSGAIQRSTKMRLGDEIYRLGNKSDEFVVVAMAGTSVARKIVENIFAELQAMNSQKQTKELIVNITASAGIASISQFAIDRAGEINEVHIAGQLIDSADKAMYQAKKTKTNEKSGVAQSTMEVYTPEKTE